MNAFVIAALLLVLLTISYQVGWSRSRRLAGASSERLHSRPIYHGVLVALFALLPAIVVLGLWALFSGSVSRAFILAQLPPETAQLSQVQLQAAIGRVQAIATGFGVAGEPAPEEVAAARAFETFQLVSFLAVIGAAAALGAGALFLAQRRIGLRLRARTEVEIAVRIGLIACSTVAILTTIGIVLSLLADALRFFSFINPLEFFFGTTWNPRFQSTGTGSAGEYGLLPLLWGTVMISLIAMLVAVPIGLMSAIYLSQYAHERVRNVVKPIIEVLAGIPTIVYGFFALVTVGPFLAGVGDAVGLDINATSALTAGVVMGIMIIPFISSLSDDIIAQVPRAMRDGSLGLGATQSETIRRVLLPAALPGIVGAILLAVSRAIGETMIVVLAAGNSPVLRFNPAEPTSTVTVSIVNQLTGDADFTSPQSLVAFALGLTLFVMTLLLNVLALYIVRKFREQYE
ncbi:phosphate ABC transporter permease subunit PstC [Pelagibacterium halotolerans]|uniref:Phosphate transport system permease protein n=1 Tax=Pelagibacterium halotolerans (strain DSM 22347 / JCM 15775 / CGMCC 1.7692 / B2) TaxID=1082931 RepID=G4R8R3_PELHB|nr:phosphate ABC transporter permease subunit PstC [Pelagibacterium halotolerans]AEQ50349.1 phosphate transport system permease protein PstC [Pelagibacterium halotolerans B2]QJR19671.1 phosphate ABC transporter permease subunit PstC [Pelagibacterium halotolerans]SEA98404.1 phosphate ABC transporter membrane protein 1, PhoT family [Pelagibacterium halotolerans]